MMQGSSVWYNSVIRADINKIEIGMHSNVQDGSVLHVTRSLPLKLGRGVSVGHNVTLHGCIIEDNVLVGNGSIVLDGCVIGEGCLVGAGSLLPPRKVYPPRVLIIGSPARVIRDLTETELADIKDNSDRYVEYAAAHKQLINNIN